MDSLLKDLTDYLKIYFLVHVVIIYSGLFYDYVRQFLKNWKKLDCCDYLGIIILVLPTFCVGFIIKKPVNTENFLEAIAIMGFPILANLYIKLKKYSREAEKKFRKSL